MNGPEKSPPAGRPEEVIGSARRLIVYALLVGIVAAHAAAFLGKRELWPVSHYPMYSKCYPTSWSTYQLVLVAADGSGTEVQVPLSDLGRPISVVCSFDRIVPLVARGERMPEELDEPLKWVGERCQRLAASRKGTLAVERVRLYEDRWELRREPRRIGVGHSSHLLVREVELTLNQR